MQIKIQMSDVYQASNYLSQKAQEYENELQKINTTVHELQSVWQGTDNQSYIQKMDAFQPQLRKIISIINAYAKYLNTSASRYEQLQQERSMSANRLA